MRAKGEDWGEGVHRSHSFARRRVGVTQRGPGCVKDRDEPLTPQQAQFWMLDEDWWAAVQAVRDAVAQFVAHELTGPSPEDGGGDHSRSEEGGGTSRRDRVSLSSQWDKS